MELLITILIWALFGWLGYSMAEKRGRNSALWAVASLLFGIFAIIVLAILGDADQPGADVDDLA